MHTHTYIHRYPKRDIDGVLRKDVKIAAGVDMTLILALTAEWELNRTWLSTGGGMR